jgi:hypothetical protein
MVMTMKTCWESIKVEGGNVLDKLKELLREGNIRRVRVVQGGRTVAEFPLTVGVVGVVFAPILAAVGAVIALLQDCTIYVERAQADASAQPQESATASPPPNVM